MITLTIPTGNRSLLLRRALAQIARQTYEGPIEVVIVDGGSRPLKSSSGEWLHPRREGLEPLRVKYRRISESSTVGMRRNVAVQHATGEIIGHWDDDDFYAPNYLATQLEWFESMPVDLGGVCQFYYYDFLVKRGWQSHLWNAKPSSGAFGACFLYRKRTWRHVGGFQDIQRGEDNEFAKAFLAKGLRVAAVERPELFVYIRHTRNISSWTVPIFHPDWTRAAREIIGDEIGFYDDLSELVDPPTPKDLGPQFHLPVDLRTMKGPRPGG